MARLESNSKTIPFSGEHVYNKLSDLHTLDGVKDKIPQDIMAIENGLITFNLPPVGTVELEIVDREPPTCIKLKTIRAPMPFDLWIQILPVTETECQMSLILLVDISPFMKSMMQQSILEGLNKMAGMIALIPY